MTEHVEAGADSAFVHNHLSLQCLEGHNLGKPDFAHLPDRVFELVHVRNIAAEMSASPERPHCVIHRIPRIRDVDHHSVDVLLQFRLADVVDLEVPIRFVVRERDIAARNVRVVCPGLV